MSKTGAKHECHDTSGDCGIPIHLMWGVGKNILSVWHFGSTVELEAFLAFQKWPAARVRTLLAGDTVEQGGAWARLRQNSFEPGQREQNSGG